MNLVMRKDKAGEDSKSTLEGKKFSTILDATLKSYGSRNSTAHSISTCTDSQQRNHELLRCKRKDILAQINIFIPDSLLSISLFLEEALHSLRRSVELFSLSIADLCISHALRLYYQYKWTLDDSARDCLGSFIKLKENIAVCITNDDHLAADSPEMIIEALFLDVSSACFDITRDDETSINVEGDAVASSGGSGKRISRDMLVDEAKAFSEIAKVTAAFACSADAARLFDSVCLYLRMAQPLSVSMQSLLDTSAALARELSQTSHNLIQENAVTSFSSKYKLTGICLDSGTFGSVDVCEHKSLGDRLARKCIIVNANSVALIHSLQSEIEILKCLDHPNTINLKEVFCGSDEVYLVMQLCTGQNLASCLAKISPVNAVPLLRTMLATVDYLHSKGIVHRDIKLEHFVFESSAPNAQLILIDFGLSKHFDEGERMGKIVGTPYYIAPEVWGGEYDYRCDNWALGICAFIMLYSSIPFNGEDMEEVCRKTQEVEPIFPLGPPTLPAAKAFVQSLLHKDPRQRLSLKAALQHPFFNALPAKSADTSVRTDIAKKLIRYLGMTEAEQLLLRTVASTLSSSHIITLRNGFYDIDVDNLGEISMQSLHAYLIECNVKGASELKEALTDINCASMFSMRYSDFIAAILCKHSEVEEKRLLVAFSKLDRVNQGFLTPASIKQALGINAEYKSNVCSNFLHFHLQRKGASNTVVGRIFDDVDSNNDGRIDFEEFRAYWRHLSISKHGMLKQRFAKAVNVVSTALRLR